MFVRCGFAIYDNFLVDIDTINDTFIFYFSKGLRYPRLISKYLFAIILYQNTLTMTNKHNLFGITVNGISNAPLV